MVSPKHTVNDIYYIKHLNLLGNMERQLDREGLRDYTGAS